MSRDDLLWAAGFIEGEGNFRFDSTMRVRASQRQLWPLQKLQAQFEGNIYEAKTPKGKSYGIWELTGPRAERLLFALLPLMSPGRQHQAFRAIIKRKLQPRLGSAEHRANSAKAGRAGTVARWGNRPPG